MSKDTRVDALQAAKIVASSSSGQLLVYGIDHENKDNPNQGEQRAGFPQPGTDVFLFVSGGIDTDKSLFGGSVVVSGGLTADTINLAGDVPLVVGQGSVSVSVVDGQYIVSASIVAGSSSGPGVSDHGDLTGLGDNDHPQYLLTSSFAPISTSIATDISAANTRITTVSSSVASDIILANNARVTLSSSVAADINAGNSARTTLSSSVAADIIAANNARVALSSSVAADVITINNRITSVSSSVASDIVSGNSARTALSSSVAADIIAANSARTALSGVVATDINSLRNDIQNVTGSGDPSFFHSPSSNVIAASGSLRISGSFIAHSGISGALNHLPDGSPLLVGTNGVAVSTGSNGRITATISEPSFFAGSRTHTAGTLTLTADDNNRTVYVSSSTDITAEFGAMSSETTIAFTQVSSGKILFTSTSPTLIFPPGTISASYGQGSTVVVRYSGSFAFVSGDLETDVESIPPAVDTAIDNIRFLSSEEIAGTDFTLTDAQSGKVLYCVNAANTTIRVPPNLRDGFHCVAVQSSASGSVLVAATASLLVASVYTTSSAEQYSHITIISGSGRLTLGGDLKVIV